MKDVAKCQRICSAIDSWCERDHHVPRLSWSTKVPKITPAWLWPWSQWKQMLRPKTWWNKPHFRKASEDRHDTWTNVLPLMLKWYVIPPQNLDYSGKKRRKEENLKRLHFKMEMTQVSRIGTTKCSALQGDGIMRAKFNFSHRQRKLYPCTSGLLYCENVFSLYLFRLLLI